MKVEVINIKGDIVKEKNLPEEVFDGKVNVSLLHQAVQSYISNSHSVRLASVKDRSEVRGSGEKPWRQKGTGRARVGDKRNPVWVKGGIVFGPKPKKVNKKLSKKMKLGALKSALNSKVNDDEIIVLDKLEMDLPKTKKLVSILKEIGVDKRVVFVDEKISDSLRIASRNLKKLSLFRANDLNAYLVVNCKKLIVTEAGLEIIKQRVS